MTDVLQLKLKKKKTKKKRIIFCILTLLVIGGCGGYYYMQSVKAADESDEIVIDVADNQSIVYGEIKNISGNDITYTVMNKVEASTEASTEAAGQIQGDAPATKMNAETVTGEMSTEEVTGAMSTEEGGSMPQMSGDASSAMPQMNADESGSMPQMSGDTSETTTEDIYVATEEEVSTTIPVGTDVTTKLGTVTTFSRLSTGDIIEMIVEKDGDDSQIISIWIVG